MNQKLFVGAVSFGWLALIAQPSSSWPTFMAPLVVAGLGMGCIFAPMITVASVPRPSVLNDIVSRSTAAATMRTGAVIAMWRSALPKYRGKTSGSAVTCWTMI